MTENTTITKTELFSNVRTLIEESRTRVAVSVNAELSLLYWHIGNRINTEILNDKRAEYGKQIVVSLSRQLTKEYVKGWSERQLRYFILLVEIFPDKKILHTLCAELSWSHIRQLIHINDPIKRKFYTEICKLERWSSRQLQERMNSLLYERTAISKKPEKTISHDLNQLKRDGIIQLIYFFAILIYLIFWIFQTCIRKRILNLPFL